VESEVFWWSRSRIFFPFHVESDWSRSFFLVEWESDFFVWLRLRKSNWIIFLLHTPKSGISVEMVKFLMKRLLKQIILPLYHDFHWVLCATKFLTTKIHSLYVSKWESENLERPESGVGNFGKVGHFTSDSAPLVVRKKVGMRTCIGIWTIFPNTFEYHQDLISIPPLRQTLRTPSLGYLPRHKFQVSASEEPLPSSLLNVIALAAIVGSNLGQMRQSQPLGTALELPKI